MIRTPRIVFRPVATTIAPLLIALVTLTGCPSEPAPPVVEDSGVAADSGVEPSDASTDAGLPDASLDAGLDAGEDAGAPLEDAGAQGDDAGTPAEDAGLPAEDAGAPDGGEADAGVPPLPEWPPVFISAFGLSYDGPVSDGEDVWVELTVAHADALAQLGGWSYWSANHAYVNQQLESAQLPFALADGDVLRVHGASYTGTTDSQKSDNNPRVWDFVSSEPFGPSFKHGLLWLEAADGTVLDAVVYETGRNQIDWLREAALAAAQKVVDAAEWPSTSPDDAVAIPDADRHWARLRRASEGEGDAAGDWQIVGATLETYYERAMGKTGSELKAALHEIIANHVVLSYRDDVNAAFSVTDADPNNPGSIIQFYTGQSTRSDFNKEHIWAKSHGGFGSDAYAGYSDLHNLRPTRPDVNSARWHLDFAEGGVPYSDTACNIVDGVSFEPRDEVKGDVARTLFYMAVRYEGDDPPMPDLELVEAIPSLLNAQGQPDNNHHMSTPRHGKLSHLLQWHIDDPPDDRERARNDVIFETFQRNRNPFVDHPEWVHEIWGGPEWPHAAR
ncbi:MAG: endonuclease I family protein [Myxococcales bacterium]